MPSGRFCLYLVLLLLGLGFAVCAATVCIPSGPLHASTPAPGETALETAQKLFTPEEMGEWKAYSKQKLELHLIKLGSILFFYALFLLTGFNRRLKAFSLRMTDRVYARPGLSWIRTVPETLFGNREGLALIFYAPLFIFILRLFFFPQDFYRSYVFEHLHDMSNYSLGLWFLDYFRGMCFSTLLFTFMVFGIYGLLIRVGRKWWLLVWAGVSVAIWAYTFIVPYTAHISNDFWPLKQGELRTRIEALAKQKGIEIEDIYVVDASRRTKKVNAYFVGTGPTQRIVLYDNLINQFTTREVEVVLAHEMAHWKEPKALSFLLFSGTVLLVLFLADRSLRWGTTIHRFHYSSITDIASLPFLFLVFFLIFQAIHPVSNFRSRWHESQADREAMEAVCDPEAFVQAYAKLTRINAADVTPHPLVVFFFYSHPPFLERIQWARSVDCPAPAPHPQQGTHEPVK